MFKKYGLYFFLIVKIIFLCSCLGPGHGQRTELTQASIGLQSITGDKLLGYVKKMSSEEYAGRLTGTMEYKRCAEWTDALFNKWGLNAEGDDRTGLQSYPNPHTIVFVGGGLSLHPSRGRQKKYKYERDYYPGSASEDGRVTAEVVYVGFGIKAPELEYDEYANVNVKGKVVLVEPGVPVFYKDDPDKFKEWAPYASLQYKAKMARAHGARGFLWNELAVLPEAEYISGLSVSNISPVVTSDILAGAGKNHHDILSAIRTDLKPNSFRTRQRMTLYNMTEHHRRSRGYNIVRYISGVDPELKEEVIIVGANLDHVGFCYEVMPGANDNASGMAVLLGVAEAMSKSPVKPKRTILFLAFGSGKQGFQGVQAYLKKPLFPLNKTKLFIGLERVGRGNEIFVSGSEDHSAIYKDLVKTNRKHGSFKMGGPWLPAPGLPSSEAQYFLKKRIQALLLSTEKEPVYFPGRLDTYKKIDPLTLTGLVNVLHYFMLDIAGQKNLGR